MIRYTTTEYELVKSRKTDSGYDIRSSETVTLKPLETRIISTGIAVELPKFIEIQVRPRSGNSSKGLLVHLGTIDSEYRGYIGIIVTNLSKEDYFINKGDKIAQLVLANLCSDNLVLAKSIDKDTDRGSKGFGSSGV